MKRRAPWSLLIIVFLICVFLTYIPSASSSSAKNEAVARATASTFSILSPPLPATLNVDRTDDSPAFTACTVAPNDCSLRGAIIAANISVADPVTINLQPGTTYNLTIPNASQENAAATGDLDITASGRTVTIAGGGSSGPGATIIDAAGLNTGSSRDRAFQITTSGGIVIFQDLVIQNGRAADGGNSGASTNPTAHNSTRAGGCILNGAGIDINQVAVIGGGSVTLDNVTIQSCQVLGKGDDLVNENRTLEAWGGGLASLGTTGNVIIADSTFTGNTALGGNGGNFNNGGGSSVRGGSIYFGGGTLDVDGTRIVNSNATGGTGGNGPGNQSNGGVGGTAYGGGAYIAGTSSIDNSTFENCAATGGNSGTGQNGSNFGADSGGGGLFSLGNVTVTNSTFNLNSANGGDAGDTFGPDCFGAHQSGDGGAARGGAVQADAGSLTINTATFANNSANGGNGGDGGPTNVGTCSQSAHGAGGLAHGGAITNTNTATVNIKHATISGNNAQAGNTGVNQAGANRPPRLVAEGTGGGIRVGPASVTLENTIIAGNTAANGLGDTTAAPIAGPNVDGTVTSLGHNLLGTATEANGFTGSGDQTGANPLLAPLANNGGPTQTMALTPTSPAIDAGVAAASSFDQRALPRTYNDPGVANAATSDATDIGAFELQPLCSLSCPADVNVSNDPGVCGAVVTYTMPSGTGCGAVTTDHPSGSFFPVGNTTVTITSSVGPSCSFVVTVNDTENPTITAPAGFTVDADADSCMATGVSLGTAATADNCAVLPATNDAPAAFPLGPTTVTWTVMDNHGHSATATQVITVIDNTSPSLTVPPNSSALADASCQAAIPDVVSGSTGTDNCGPVIITQSPVAGTMVGLGANFITVTATDGSGNQTDQTVTFTVIDTTPPSLAVPPNSSGFANASCQALIPNVVAGSTAADNCGPVTISQSPAAGTVVSLGTHVITVTATDGAGNYTDMPVTFTVIDNTPPAITFNGNVITLWSPNHQYETVQVSDLVASASDNCDAGVSLSSVYISKVTSDEVDNGAADGNSVNDIVIAADCKSVQLRAERAGNLDGRVYTITFKVTDASGNLTTATAAVTVPHSQNGGPAVDSGPHNTVVSGCP